MYIKKALKHWRRQYRFTQTEAAQFLGCSQGTYSKLENGKLKPTLKQFFLLKDGFNVELSYKEWMGMDKYK